MPAFRLLPQVRTTIPLIPPGLVDEWLTETHGLDVELTEHPIERGATLTDHAIVGPRTLHLQGAVSDAQPSGAFSAIGLPSARIPIVVGLIRQFQKRKVLLDVVSPFALYRNMMIVRVTEPRTVQTGGSLIFRLELREVLFSESAVTRIARAFAENFAFDRTSVVDTGSKVVSNPLWSRPCGASWGSADG